MMREDSTSKGSVFPNSTTSLGLVERREASSDTTLRVKQVLGQAALISTKQAASIFGVTERTVRRWLASGRMPQQVQVGREKKFCKEAIEAEIKMDVFETITLTEASKLLGRSNRTILRWIASGKMPGRIKRGNENKFRYTDILWLRELLINGGETIP
jgi:excisionase family DNA binding protein